MKKKRTNPYKKANEAFLAVKALEEWTISRLSRTHRLPERLEEG